MATISRPFALGFSTLASIPLSAAAASPWTVNDGSTLQVTSDYYSTETKDIPLQVSGAGSQLITDSGLTFITTAIGTPVAKVTDRGSLSLNGATLSASGESAQAVNVNTGTLNIVDSSLSASGAQGATIKATDSTVVIKNSSLAIQGNGQAIAMAGGTLEISKVTINGSAVGASYGIEVTESGGVYGRATLTDTQITMANNDAFQALYAKRGHITGTNVTIVSSSETHPAVQVGDGLKGMARSTLTLTDSSITSSHVGIRTMGGDATLNNVTIITKSNNGNEGNYALDINAASDVIIRGGSYTTFKELSHAVDMSGTDTTLDASGARFTTNGAYSHAINAAFGKANLVDSTIETLGYGSDGLYTQNSITGSGLTILTLGERGYGVVAVKHNTFTEGGTITLDKSKITTAGKLAYGAAAGSESTLEIANTAINTAGESAYGVYGVKAKNIQLDNSAITTAGTQAYGVRVQGGSTTLTGTTIKTSGQLAYAVAATDSATVGVDNSIILASGSDSAGLYAGSSAVVTGTNIDVTASGDNAFGLVVALGEIHLSDSNIVNSGTATTSKDPSAVGLYAIGNSETQKNTVSLDNTTLRSEAGSGVVVKGSRLDLSLSNNSFVYGGDGTALSAITNTDDGNSVNAEVNVTANSKSQLLGDVVTDSYDNVINLTLNESSTLNGAVQNVNQLLLNSGSSWLVTADSNLKTLTLKDSSVIFNRASGFSTITVDGDLSGSGAFFFNTQLGADDSASDKLLVSGNASGSYDVSVSNRGGTGAKTDAGILLVQVAGDASGAEFKQKNTVVAGNYEYFLYKIGNQSWYLQSSLVPVTPPAESTESDEVPVDNGASEDEVPVDTPDTVPPGVKAYRPETAGYLIAPYLNSAYGFETVGTWHERLGAYQGGSVWLRVSGRHDRYDAGRFAFNVNTTFVQLGGDLATRQLTDGWQLTAGPMMTLGHQRSSNKDTARSLRSDISVNVGQTDTNAYGLGGYLTVWNEGGAYLDNVVQLTRYSNEFVSMTNAKMDSYGVVASVETGIPLSLGGGFKLEPQLQAVGQYMNISQTHADGVELKDQNLMMARLREGLRLYYDNPVLKPYLQLDAVQFLGHTPGVDMNDETMRPDVRRGYWQAGAGLSSQLNPHFSVYAQLKYSHSFGPGAEGYTGNMGLRYKF